MIDPRIKVLNDDEETLRTILDGRQTEIWTAIPGIIQSVNMTKMTCVVQPAIQELVNDQYGKQTVTNLPLLLDVPIVWPSGGGFTITFPMALGDEVLVVFSSRMIDQWWNSGKISLANEARMHDLSDGFCIPGPKSVPNAAQVSGISSTKLQIRNNAGTVYLNVGSKFAITNATTSLSTVLNNLTTALNALATGLQANPSVETAADASGIALAAALTPIVAELSALLET